MLFAAALLIPAVLMGAWAVLQFGGSIDRLTAEEQLRGQRAADIFVTTLHRELKSTPYAPEPRWREAAAPPSHSLRIGLEFERQGAPKQALAYFDRAPSPLSAPVQLAKARALLALGRRPQAWEVLGPELPDDLAIRGVPTQLTRAQLRLQIATRSPAHAKAVAEIRDSILDGEMSIPPHLAARVAESVAELTAVDPKSTERFAQLAEARTVLAATPNNLPTTAAWITPQVYFDPATRSLSTLDDRDSARRVAADELKDRFGFLATETPATGRRLAEADLGELGPDNLTIAAADARGSEQLHQVSRACLGLALVTFLLGNLALLYVSRRTTDWPD